MSRTKAPLEAEVHRLRAQLKQRRAEAKSERELAERRGELAQELREELDSILLHHKKSERECAALRERAESAEAELTKLAQALSLKTNGAMDGTISAAARLVNLLDRQLTARAEKAERALEDAANWRCVGPDAPAGDCRGAPLEEMCVACAAHEWSERAEKAERALASLRDSKVLPVVDLDNDTLHRECREGLASEWERAYRAGLEAAARDVCESPGRFAWTAQSSTAEQFGWRFAKYIRALPVPPRPEEGK